MLSRKERDLIMSMVDYGSAYRDAMENLLRVYRELVWRAEEARTAQGHYDRQRQLVDKLLAETTPKPKPKRRRP